MEKIVKLEEFNWVSGRDAITIALCNTIIRKQNEIIDHLNSQDQEEDKYKKGDKVKLTLADKDGWVAGEFEVVGVEVEQPEKGKRKRLEDLTDEELKERGITKTEDTPEQKEEWEKELLTLCGKAKDFDEITGFIKNLLSEGEVFTKDELFMLKLATNDIHNKGNGAYDEIEKKIERMLSKLNKKK